MAEDIDKKPIARIYRLAAEDAEGAKGLVEGMGFLISDRHVLTCAHVVESALGKAGSELKVAPTAEVQLDFPFADRVGADWLARSGQVIYWRPVDSSIREADIAVLRLDKPVPAAVCPAKLSHSLDNHWRAYGSPKDGYWCKGTFSDVTERHWRQLDGAKIVEGFSGTPVWHGSESLVTGMVVARMGGVGLQPAFMLPAELLKSAIGTADADTLFAYLSPYYPALAASIKQAYRQCLPEMWGGAEPENFEGMLATLGQDVLDDQGPGGEPYSALVQFAAVLMESASVSQTIRDLLTAWLKSKVTDVAVLLTFVAQRRPPRDEAAAQASLLFQVSFSQTKDLSQYMVKAWLISNPAHYSSEQRMGCEPLTISEDAEQTYTLDEIPNLLGKCLDQAFEEHQVSDPILEIFLPLRRLNDAVEVDWTIEDEDDDPLAVAEPRKIGWRYKVILRSSDRAGWPYKKKSKLRMADWYERWKQVDAILSEGSCPACDIFIDGRDSKELPSLTDRLTPLDALGVKFSHVPSVEARQEIATTLGLSIPVAVWARCPIPDAQTKLDGFLAGCLQAAKMLEHAKQQRCNPKNDLDGNLALLWDNPNLLPPFDR